MKFANRAGTMNHGPLRWRQWATTSSLLLFAIAAMDLSGPASALQFSGPAAGGPAIAGPATANPQSGVTNSKSLVQPLQTPLTEAAVVAPPEVEKPEIAADRGPQFGPATRVKWRVACKIVASSGALSNVIVTMPIPQDWPEQSVFAGPEDVPPETVDLIIRDLPRAPRQIVARLPALRKGDSALFSVDYDVEVRTTLPPADSSLYQIPPKLEKDMKHWLEDSPAIEVKDVKIRKALESILESQPPTAWEQVDAIREWIVANIQPSNEAAESTLETLKSLGGTNENRLRLFVALCRAAKVPARMVWSDGNDHAEFYLIDDSGAGYWFPCHLSPAIGLGSNPRANVVLQKGDHFLVPEKKKQEIDFVTGFVSASGGGKPAVGFVEGPVND